MYKITFKDKSTFLGGDVKNSKWNIIPNKDIAKIEITMFKRPIILENFESYNLLIEKTSLITMTGGGIGDILSNIVFMGKKKEEVQCVIYNVKSGRVYKKESKFGKEYVLPVFDKNGDLKGWTSGIKSSGWKGCLSAI